MANAYGDIEKAPTTKSEIRPIYVCERPAWILDISQ